MKERIFDLRLDVKDPEIPFAVEKSIGVQSGSLIEVFSRFQLELVKLLQDLAQEDKAEMIDDDIPF